ncbi:flagellar basal body-associated FliL family protein [Cribrihabitans pelagius]|uniref:flagellar basal body-associated FliL family protein n=1 Tax=Cribrihabitans pelagius TaxID=1765746 RepID=UPI003B5BA98D
MLSKLLPVILLVAGTGGGIGAGIMLAPEPEAPPPAETAEGGADPAHTPEPEPEADLAAGGEALEREYIKIANQFVVPVVERDVLSSLVVISLSLEAKKGTSEKVHAYEPKLRDVFLQVLFDHANMGGFRGAFTRSDVLNPLRNALREAAQKQMGKDIYDVLIMEMSRQDV